jgi:transcriptional regulator with XRE-family HTH domain
MMVQPSNQLASWLNVSMQAQGLSQAALARTIGVADAQVSRWRRGQVVPTVHYLQRLADAFGVPRASLDRLAGYPVAEEESDERADPAAAERQAYQAWFGRLLEQKLPHSMWPAYAEACEALAEALSAAFQTATAQAERAVGEAAASADGSAEHGPLGFRSEVKHDT